MTDTHVPSFAVITGASRGIGRALAVRCARAGARVALLARSAGPLTELAAELGDRAVPIPCDLADPAAVERAAALVRQLDPAGPDLLVNNAGLFHLAAIETTTPGEFRALLDTNLVAPFLLVRALLPAMRARGAATIVTVGSIADRLAFPENAAYAASKFGVRALHEVLRAELQGTGVRAVLVSPGPVDTPLWDAHDPDARPGFTPRARMLTADDVADAAWFAATRPAHVNIDELRLSRS
jgi:NADP-dependent 3-hydroxy acid dehydrogenase YdfG